MDSIMVIKLIPSLYPDAETGMVSARFSEFPAVVVHDESKHKAEDRLIQLFEAMVYNEPNYIIGVVNKNYNTNFKVETSRITITTKRHQNQANEVVLKLPVMA